MKELTIGEIAVIDGVKVQCRRPLLSSARRCRHCCFDDYDLCKFAMCSRHFRTDHTDVYFKRIN